MEVVRASKAGACYGVQRALDMAHGVLAEGSCAYTLGPLIHNPLVVEELEQRGARVAKNLDEVQGECATVIIRSHGVTPQVRDAVLERGYQLVDATCPHVARAQQGAAELAEAGCRVVILGEADHPEVEGLRAYAEEAGGKVDVVGGPDDIPDGLYAPIGVVAQTTQTRENLEAVLAELNARGLDPIVKKTICYATRQRQDAAAELASRVDAMVVIGGRNSSNTTRLAEICEATCSRSFHIESADELKAEMFAGCETVGVTAGASTPDSHINAVEEVLRSF
ncbi:MAG: 4-hydroxy-3-methylbut-2-enyl diphosphate reductase [Eggerthellaceae bacterium]|nr:4-hydroxy-3-methylbut-2-enyl diphosphate reductase [Eggerthellaceae bacterium]